MTPITRQYRAGLEHHPGGPLPPMRLLPALFFVPGLLGAAGWICWVMLVLGMVVLTVCGPVAPFFFPFEQGMGRLDSRPSSSFFRQWRGDVIIQGAGDVVNLLAGLAMVAGLVVVAVMAWRRS